MGMGNYKNNFKLIYYAVSLQTLYNYLEYIVQNVKFKLTVK